MDMLIDVLLAHLLATSLQTLVLAALVWLVCSGLRRLPANTQCWLWWLVAMQAVFGLMAPAALELPLLPAAQTSAQVTATTLPTVTSLATQPADIASSGWAWTPSLVLVALWAAGVLLLSLRTMLAFIASRRLLKSSLPCPDLRLERALQMAADAHGLRRAPRLRLSAAIDSPQLVGPWHPVLLLPARRWADMAEDERDMALTHELVHLCRRDLWLGLLPALAQHLFFFHPAVHLAAREYTIAREGACDAAVVAGNQHCRQHYGRLLVQMGVATRPAIGGVGSASPSFRSLRRRLQFLQQASRLPKAVGFVVVALVMVAALPMRLVAQPIESDELLAPAAPMPLQPPAPPAPPAAPPAPPAAPKAPSVPTPPEPPTPPRAPAAPESPAPSAAPKATASTASPGMFETVTVPAAAPAPVVAGLSEEDRRDIQQAIAEAHREAREQIIETLGDAHEDLADSLADLAESAADFGTQAAGLALQQAATQLRAMEPQLREAARQARDEAVNVREDAKRQRKQAKAIREQAEAAREQARMARERSHATIQAQAQQIADQAMRAQTLALKQAQDALQVASASFDALDKPDVTGAADEANRAAARSE